MSSHKNLYMNGHHSIIQKSPQVETTQMALNDKTRSPHTGEYYLATKNGVLTHGAVRMNLENLRPGEGSGSEGPRGKRPAEEIYADGKMRGCRAERVGRLEEK